MDNALNGLAQKNLRTRIDTKNGKNTRRFTGVFNLNLTRKKMSRISFGLFLAMVSLPALAISGDQLAFLVPAQSTTPAQKEPGAKTKLHEDLSWMPKKETGADRFLKQHPESDGRGVVVAIFDTGVDPGAAGLQTTPDGRPKVIDMIDGTGSGDVQMGKKIKAEKRKLAGLTGRELTIDPKWKNPTGEYRRGLKAGYDLFPEDLVAILKKERTKAFKKKEREHQAELKRKLAQWDTDHPKPNAEQKKKRLELKAQIDLLDEMIKTYSDPGPIYDCLVFHDGKHFRAVVDTDADGNLAEEMVMTNFRVERKFSTFADPINVNFGVNIYESGKVLSIVTDTGAHGTHVAGIVSAYYPNKLEWNGVAPGAQIVSVKIGDTRLGGMETGPGLVRGLKAVLDNHCDLINMSYGEPTSTPNFGRVAELYAEIVQEHDVIFVSSAGNAGPALSTVGGPGGTTSELIGVGAYVSPEMMRSEYSLRQKLPGLPYTWTSRGPTSDGDLGVDIFAPGGAISPVPNWTRQASQQMNGTSMASPNACGNIALMLSAAKQKKVAYTPHAVRKAIQNTAIPVKEADVFGAGPGLLQVDKAWDYLAAHTGSYAHQLNYKLNVPALHNARGIYLREAYQTKAATSFRVSVSAKLKEKATIKQRLAVSETLTMKSTADWVQCGDLLHLTHGGNRFEVLVDPTQLKPGVHYAEVQASSKDQPGGPVFRLPVTVIIPLTNQKHVSKKGTLKWEEDFDPGIVHRKFITVPEGATWCELEMTLRQTADVKFFRIHTMQLLDGHQFEDAESGTYYKLVPDVKTIHSFPVVPGRMLEVDLAQYWSVLGKSRVKYRLRFHGSEPDNRIVTLSTGQGGTDITLRNILPAEKVSPKGTLSTLRRMISPKKYEVKVLNRDRDLLPNGDSVNELTLQYELELTKKSRVTLQIQALEDLLYDSTIGSYVYHIYDSNGRRVTTNDMFPDPISLDKGTYQVDVISRHRDASALERYKSVLLTVDQPLSKPISLSFSSSKADTAAKRGGSVAGLLVPGESKTFYLVEPTGLPTSLKAGDLLLGTIKFSADAHASTNYQVEYLYTKQSKTSSQAKSNASGALEKQIRALKLKHLATLDPTKEPFKKLFAELRKEDNKDRQPLITKLEKLDTKEKRKERLEEIIKAADELIASFDQQKMATSLGKRVPKEDKEAKKAHDEAEKGKKQLVDALYRKARAIAYRELPDVIAKHPIKNQKEQDKQFEDAYRSLETWADPASSDYWLIAVRKDRRAKHFAAAIQSLNKNLKESSPLLHFKKRRDMFGELGWDNWKTWQQQQMLLKFPKQSPPYK